MYLLILLNPLLNFFFLLCFGRILGRKGAILLTLFCTSFCWLLSFICFFYIIKTSDICYLDCLHWMSTDFSQIDFFLIFDSLTSVMLLLVLTVSLIVHVYSIDYMKYDPHLIRFLSYLSLFTFFMILLVTSSNFIQLFFGWEGVGICSYLLISFWYLRIDACKSAVKAVIFNRVGDCFLLMSIGVVYTLLKSFNFSLIFSCIYPYFFNQHFFLFNVFLIDWVVFFLIAAAIGKSAQFLLHPWLTDAMEGPTPVSALIHAATMVTAGIFLIIRLSFLINFSKFGLFFMSFIGLLTILFSSAVGCFQNDIKKIIAYSTCSQLGYMMLSCSFFNYNIALFHLFNHGFFKALLFLSAGLVIHNMSEEQDLRKLGGLLNLLPITYVFFLVGSLSLIGLPSLSGFYSKDLAIENIYIYSYTVLSVFCYYLACFCVFLTSLYSIKVMYWIFFSKPNGYKSSYKNLILGETNDLTIFLLLLLSILSVNVGFFFFDIFVGLGSTFFEGSLSMYNTFFYDNLININFSNKYTEFIVAYPNKNVPLFFIIFGFFFFMYVTIKNFIFSLIYMTKNVYYCYYVFFNQAWFINYLNEKIIKKFFLFSNLIGYFDKSILEIYGPIGVYKFLLSISKSFLKIQVNDVFIYFINLIMILIVFVIVFVYIFILYI